MDYKALPKIELHAHLTGSISRQTLHKIWAEKKSKGETELDDPLKVMPEDKYDYNLKTFFPLFSSYIYNLLTDVESIECSTRSVLEDFAADGVAYLELRTTPRATGALSAEEYIKTVLSTIQDFEASSEQTLHTKLILTIDRRHDVPTASNILALAVKYRNKGVVGIDLAGDPTSRPKGEIAIFTPLFLEASARGLGITVHFAEAEESGAKEELDILLSWKPGRLGHVIWEDDDVKKEIVKRGLCLELCLSCNVHAGMVKGGFEGHHFGTWRREENVKIALSTDDVGIFGSPLSNEYRLVAEHFDLDEKQVCELARQPIKGIFGGEEEKKRLQDLMW